MPTRDGTEARTFALLGDLEDLSEALMEMVSAGARTGGTGLARGTAACHSAREAAGRAGGAGPWPAAPRRRPRRGLEARAPRVGRVVNPGFVVKSA